MDCNELKEELNKIEEEHMKPSLLKFINPDVLSLISNPIIQKMSVIDWGKAMARPNEIIQKDILKYKKIKVFDPQEDKDCPKIDVKNNSPGFDLLVENSKGKLLRIQSKMRQVKGKEDFSQQVHFETTRRHSKKNKGSSSDSGHVAYSKDEFDFVMISLVNVKENTNKRNNLNDWSFSIVPVLELLNKKTNCCVTHIPSKLLEKYHFKFCDDKLTDYFDSFS